MSKLADNFKTKIRPQVKKDLGLKNIMSTPKIEKVVIVDLSIPNSPNSSVETNRAIKIEIPRLKICMNPDPKPVHPIPETVSFHLSGIL